MWTARFDREDLDDLDTGCDDEQEAVEFVDGWLKDAGEQAGYELISTDD